MEQKEEITNENKTYKGYSLFNGVEDFSLKSRNRGVLIANMVEEHFDTNTNRVSTRGLALILGYFNEIPSLERKAAHNALKKELANRGIKYE